MRLKCNSVGWWFGLTLMASLLGGSSQRLQAAVPPLLNEPVDVSGDFRDLGNTYFLADRLADFNASTHSGKLAWQRAHYSLQQAFDNMLAQIKPAEPNEYPKDEYAANPALPFAIEFVSPRTIRIRISSGFQNSRSQESLMLAGPVSHDNSWHFTRIPGGYSYTSAYGSLTLTENPWHLEFRDPTGQLLTRTDHASDNTTTFTPVLPFSFVRRASDYSRSIAAVFSLAPGERIYGCGESFGPLNKRGQKLVLWTDDANGVENEGMYKPIPFFLSSRGYGMFIHSSSPMTCDFGASYSGLTSLLVGDDELDLFVFLGSPRDVLNEYTALTGKSPMPPLWSFGLWMSRCTYSSEAQVRDVASKLRGNRIPCDVLHLDTGWFETDWRCDYQFSKTRFPHPEKMLADLRKEGFRVSLWQLPYFVPKNSLFPELVSHGLVVRDAKGNLPEEDAILDFSNPAAGEWYQNKLANLLKMGVSAIKVDFGEAAPANGLYASGRTGFYEHNLYPLRYNRAAADITRRITGENIIWARSAWAGSQRYPLHWGGDAENTDNGMAAELRGGLSFGLSGFSFWSHDVGGFVGRASEDLYRRWLAFGVTSSHTRCHGMAPKEPWNYSTNFMNDFRTAVEFRYRLMPYIYAQAKDCSEHGLPMLRALFLQFPEDPGSWLVEDEYMFGSSLLVAPILEETARNRQVYLPPGTWIDYFSGRSFEGGWHRLEADPIGAVVLVRAGSALPRLQLAQSTSQLNWARIELQLFPGSGTTAEGMVCLPAEGRLHPVRLEKKDDSFVLQNAPLAGKVVWTITQQPPIK